MATSKILYRGAEAIIQKKGQFLIKTRIKKGYRHPLIDEKLRKLRTRQEARLLEKAEKIIRTPKLVNVNEKEKSLVLENINGKRLSDNLEKVKNLTSVAKTIGASLGKLHDADIIHGDLTTSNLILKSKDVYFIDFGLGFHSSRIEDRAVDLHLLKEALEARHPTISEKTWKSILVGYKTSKNYQKTLKQLKKVEKRGRYKEQY